MKSQNTAVDITSFNTVKSSEDGAPLELTYGGKPVGIKLMVIGDHSDTVRAYETEKTKTFARKQQFAEKKKQELDFLLGLIDQSKERDVDAAMVRVIGWEGAGEFDKEKLRIGLTNNPQWIGEILDFSKETSNFTSAS